VDVPVRVQVDRQADVMLTNLALAPVGEKTRFLRLPAESYDELSLDILFEAEAAAGEPLSYTVDVGADGNIDWSGSAAADFPVVVTSPNMAAAFNEYLAGKTREIDVPIRIKPSPSVETALSAFSATATAKPDLAIAAGDIAFGATDPIEGDKLSLSVKLHNASSNDSSLLTAGFYATSVDGGERYIGSAFVPNVPAGRSAQAKINWNTLGFAGDVPVRVVVDPFNRLAETSETNNEASRRRRSGAAGSARDGITPDDEPMVGEISATLTLENSAKPGSWSRSWRSMTATRTAVKRPSKSSSGYRRSR
jgi:hypothetical protein